MQVVRETQNQSVRKDMTPIDELPMRNSIHGLVFFIKDDKGFAWKI